MSEEFKIPLSNALVQAIGNYLITRPYQEVAPLIAGLQAEIQTNAKPNGLLTDPPVVNDTPRDLQ